MDPTTPKPEGSIGPANLDANLVAACRPGEASATHWAYGMPLSYVHEMASQWLNLYDQKVRLSAPVPDGNRDVDSQADG